MVGIIEHGNSGASMGARAFGTGLSGFAEGFAMGEKLRQAQQETAAKVDWMAERQRGMKQDRELAQQIWNIQQEERAASSSMDTMDLRSLSAPTSRIPGVHVPWTGPTQEEIDLFPSLSAEERKARLEDWGIKRTQAIMNAEIDWMSKKVAEMQAEDGLYEGSGAKDDEQIQMLLQEAQNAVEMMASGQMTAEQAYGVVANTGNFLMESKFSREERIRTGELLHQAFEEAYQRSNGFPDDVRVKYVEEVQKAWMNGGISNAVARALLGIQNVGDAQALMAYAQGSLEQSGALQINRLGGAGARGNTPFGGGQQTLARTPMGGAPAPAEQGPPPVNPNARSFLDLPGPKQKELVAGLHDALVKDDERKAQDLLAETNVDVNDAALTEAMKELTSNIVSQQGEDIDMQPAYESAGRALFGGPQAGAPESELGTAFPEDIQGWMGEQMGALTYHVMSYFGTKLENAGLAWVRPFYAPTTPKGEVPSYGGAIMHGLRKRTQGSISRHPDEFLPGWDRVFAQLGAKAYDALPSREAVAKKAIELHLELYGHHAQRTGPFTSRGEAAVKLLAKHPADFAKLAQWRAMEFARRASVLMKNQGAPTPEAKGERADAESVPKKGRSSKWTKGGGPIPKLGRKGPHDFYGGGVKENDNQE